MITDEMRAAGWRECPTSEIRKAWEAKGGRWQTLMKDRDDDEAEAVIVRPGQLFIRFDTCARPVNSTTWDYSPDGWGETVKIERWLTEDDIENHGNLWRWWSDGWNNTYVVSELAMAYVEDGDVKVCAGYEAGWESDNFAPGDYFTPARVG